MPHHPNRHIREAIRCAEQHGWRYEFLVIIPEVDDKTAEAIYGKCGDSSLGKSNGRTYVAFDREAESLEEAIESAVADLANLGVRPLRIEMDVPAMAS